MCAGTCRGSPPDPVGPDVELGRARSFVEDTQRLCPEIADGAPSIFANGVAPKYEYPSQNERRATDTRDSRNASTVIESARCDAIGLKTVFCATKSPTYSERLEYSATAEFP